MTNQLASTSRRHWLVRSALVAGALALAACNRKTDAASQTGGATKNGANDTIPSGSSKADLLARANAYWAAVVEGDLAATWPLDMASQDGKMTLQGYLNRGGIVFDAVKIEGEPVIDGDTAVVHLRMDYDVPAIRAKMRDAESTDHWVLHAGTWYRTREEQATPTAEQGGTSPTAD